LLSKIGVLRQKPVTWVNTIGISNFSHADNSGDIEVAFGRRRRTNANSLISEPDMLQFAIGGGVNRNRFNAQLSTGTQDAQRYFTPISDQYSF
jgi:hypothetical protein